MMNFVLISKHEFIGHTKCLQLKQESMSTEAIFIMALVKHTMWHINEGFWMRFAHI